MATNASDIGHETTAHAFNGARGQGYAPAAEQRKIALFVGNDITAQLITNELVPMLIGTNIRPVIYYPQHYPSSKPEAKHPALQELAFFERTLLNETVYPYLDQNPMVEGTSASPRQLAALYGIEIERVPDINAPEFVEKIREENFLGGCSIRCYQRFHKPLINVLNTGDTPGEKGLLWNLHPGYLSTSTAEREYRGILTPMRVMIDGGKVNHWTLHEIDENYDTGPVIDRISIPINRTKPVISIYLNSVGPAASMLYSRLHGLLTTGQVPSRAAEHQQRGKLYSFPTIEELQTFYNRIPNARLVDPSPYIDFLVNTFAMPKTHYGHAHALGLETAIRKAADTFYDGLGFESDFAADPEKFFTPPELRETNGHVSPILAALGNHFRPALTGYLSRRSKLEKTLADEAGNTLMDSLPQAAPPPPV